MPCDFKTTPLMDIKLEEIEELATNIQQEEIQEKQKREVADKTTAKALQESEMVLSNNLLNKTSVSVNGKRDKKKQKNNDRDKRKKETNKQGVGSNEAKKLIRADETEDTSDDFLIAQMMQFDDEHDIVLQTDHPIWEDSENKDPSFVSHLDRRQIPRKLKLSKDTRGKREPPNPRELKIQTNNLESMPCESGDKLDQTLSQKLWPPVNIKMEVGNPETTPCESGDKLDQILSQKLRPPVNIKKEVGNPKATPCESGDKVDQVLSPKQWLQKLYEKMYGQDYSKKSPQSDTSHFQSTMEDKAFKIFAQACFAEHKNKHPDLVIELGRFMGIAQSKWAEFSEAQRKVFLGKVRRPLPGQPRQPRKMFATRKPGSHPTDAKNQQPCLEAEKNPENKHTSDKSEENLHENRKDSVIQQPFRQIIPGKSFPKINGNERIAFSTNHSWKNGAQASVNDCLDILYSETMRNSDFEINKSINITIEKVTGTISRTVEKTRVYPENFAIKQEVIEDQERNLKIYEIVHALVDNAVNFATSYFMNTR